MLDMTANLIVRDLRVQKFRRIVDNFIGLKNLLLYGQRINQYYLNDDY